MIQDDKHPEEKMSKLDEILVYGHENILGLHKSTIEFTKEDFLTPKGDCIIGIKATKSAAELDNRLKNAIISGKKIKIILQAGPYTDSIIGYGSDKLTLTNKISMVIRKSTYHCDRTVLIKSDKSARDISREIIVYMKDPSNTMRVSFYQI